MPTATSTSAFDTTVTTALRAIKLLNAGTGVTYRYAKAAVRLELVDAEDLRVHKTKLGRRVFMA